MLINVCKLNMPIISLSFANVNIYIYIYKSSDVGHDELYLMFAHGVMGHQINPSWWTH